MIKQGEIVNVRLEMVGEEAEQFLKLKNKLGVKNNAELVRVVLKKVAITEGC